MLALFAASTPVLSATATPTPAPAKPAHLVSVALPAVDTLDELDAARTWAASRPTRAKPTTAPSAPAPPAAKPPMRKKATATRPPRKPAKPRLLAAPASGNAAAVVAFALAQVGKPYRYATAGPGSFDCSGLAKASYARVGVTIPHQTGGIVRLGRPVERAQLAPGDLVFPSSGHVGIYIGGGQMVHAPKPGDHVKVSGIYSFWTARRLL